MKNTPHYTGKLGSSCFVKRYFFSLLSGIFFMLVLPASVSAATKTWNGSISTEWGNAGNWSSSTLPVAGDAVTIGSGGNQPVISYETVTITSLTISSGATLSITGGSILVSGGTISVSGTIAQSGGTFLSTINLTLSSGASINMSATGLMHLSSSTGTSPTNSLTVAANTTISQSGGTIEVLDLSTNTGSPAGNFSQSGGTVSVYRDYKSGGVFNATAGTIQFMGTASSPTFSTGTNQFYNVVVNAAANPKFDVAASSAILVRGDFTYNSTTAIGVNSTITFNGSSNQNIYSAVSTASTAFGTFIVNKSGGKAIITSNVKITANLTVTTGTLDLDVYFANRSVSGGTLTVSGGAVLMLGANSGGQTGSNFPLNFSTVSLAANSTVEYSGSNAVTQTIYGTPAYSNITLTNGTASGTASKITTANITASGVLTINAGAVLTPAAANTIGVTGTITGTGTAQVTRTAATPDFSTQYSISNKTLTNLTVDYNATVAQTISAVNYGHLAISGTRTTATITLAATGTIGIAGNFTNTVTFTTGSFTTTGSTVSFNGIATQNIPAFIFNNLTIAKSSADAVLSANITIAGTLTFTQGKINTGNYTAISTSGTVNGASQSTGWVNGNLEKSFSAGTLSRSFETGGGSYYSPITLTFASVTGTGDIIASTIEANHPNIGQQGFTASKNIARYWRLTNAGGITFTSYTISLTWNSAENYASFLTSLLRVAKFTGAAWSLPTITGTPTVTNIQANNITSMGDFIVGEVCDAAAGFNYPASPYCSNAGSASITLNSGSAAGAFTYTPAGLSINGSTGVVNLSAGTAGAYIVTNAVSGSNGCSASAIANISITVAPSATISYGGNPYCNGGGIATVTHTGTTGGTYSSTAGLSINATTGEITLASSAEGTYTVTYTIGAANGCAQFNATSSVTITSTPVAAISYTGSPYCSSSGTAIVTRTGSTGGIYSSTPGVSIDANTGDINTTTSTAGTYTVTTTVSGGCAATVNTTITITAAPSSTISYTGSPYCNNGGTATVTQTGTTGGIFSSTAGLSVNAGSGSITLNTSTAGTYTVTYTVSAAGGCSQLQTTSNLVIKPLGVWIGAISTSWNNAANWQCSAIPTNTTSVVIPTSAFLYPTLAGTAIEIKDLTLESGAMLTVSNANLKIKGTVTTNGGKINSTTGKVEFTGTTAQVIPASLFLANKTKDLYISNTAGVTLSGSLKVTGNFGFGLVSNATFNTGGFLTLGSDSSSTASVVDITNGGFSTGNSINGTVTVERFVGSRRAYRFLTAPVNCSDNIRANWMEGVNNPDIITWLNPFPGYGTHITGQGSSVNGFDATNTNNPSLFMFNNDSQAWYPATNINVVMQAGSPYRIMVRGDRSTDLNTNTPPPSITTLRARGTLKTGTITLAKAGAGGTAGMPVLSSIMSNYNFVANPYASALNWLSVEKNDLSNTIYIWDPTVSGSGNKGAYVAFNGILNSNNNIASNINNHIQSGQAFFVQTTGSNPSLIVRETHKSGVYRPVFRENNQSAKLAIQLLLPSQAGTDQAADGAMVVFSPALSNALSGEDSYKLTNVDENFGILRDSAVLSIEGRQPVVTADTIPLKIWQLTQSSYILKVLLTNFDSTLNGFMEDKYLNTSTPLHINDTTFIAFNLIADPASRDADRFRIVFHASATLPVLLNNLEASPKNEGVEVRWTVRSESNIGSYNVEKSADTQLFETAGTVTAKNNYNAATGYSFFDRSPYDGDNYYRVKSVTKTGAVKYSEIVKVRLSNNKGSISVLPNPVHGSSLQVVFKTLESGKYSVRLMGADGQAVYTGNIYHDSRKGKYKISLSNMLPAGLYRLQLSKGDKIQTITVLCN